MKLVPDVEHAAEGVHPGALRPLLRVAVARGQDDPRSRRKTD